MAEEHGKVYKKTELVGTSNISHEDAVKRAVDRARQTLRNLEWFEVKEERGRITSGEIEYQVTLEVGFAIEEAHA